MLKNPIEVIIAVKSFKYLFNQLFLIPSPPFLDFARPVLLERLYAFSPYDVLYSPRGLSSFPFFPAVDAEVEEFIVEERIRWGCVGYGEGDDVAREDKFGFVGFVVLCESVV